MKGVRGIRVDGEMLRRMRRDRGSTQEVVASLSGLSVKLVRKAEQGQPIDAESVATLAAFYSSSERSIAPNELVLSCDRSTSESVASMSSPALDAWLYSVWKQGDWKVLDQLVAYDVRFHCRIGLLESREQLRTEIERIRSSFADFDISIKSCTAYGALIVARWQMAMRQIDRWLGRTPSDEVLVVTGVTTFRIVGGVISEGWEFWHPLPIYERLVRNSAEGQDVRQDQIPRDLGTPASQSILHPRSFRLRGEFVRSLRVQRAWTQRHAAKALGVAERLLRKAESGGPVNLESLASLANGYTAAGQRVTPEQLLTNPNELQFSPPQTFDLGDRVQRWFDAQWNSPDFDLLDELATPDFVFHTEVGPIRGPAELKERIREFRKSFADFRMVAEEVCDLGTAVAVRWICTMTHCGPWLNLPATDRKVVVRGSSFALLVGDKFGDAWDFWDPAVIYRQIVDGELPPD